MFQGQAVEGSSRVATPAACLASSARSARRRAADFTAVAMHEKFYGSGASPSPFCSAVALCQGIASGACDVTCGILGFAWRLARCSCMRSSSSSTTGLRWSYRKDTSHMAWSRRYYWRSNRSRWFQRVVILIALLATCGIFYLDTGNMPVEFQDESTLGSAPVTGDSGAGVLLSDGAASPSDSASSLGRAGSYSPNKRDPSASKHRSVDVDKSSSASQSHPFRRRTSRSTGPAKILIIITSAGFVGDESAVNAALDTWGQPGRLERAGIRIVFLHCNRIRNETTWCPPMSGPDPRAALARDSTRAFMWALRRAVALRSASHWIVRAEAGTYLLPDNLKRFLSHLDANLPHFIGHRVPASDGAFHDPRAGIALSLAAAELVGVGCRGQGNDGFGPRLARCCLEAGVRVASTANLDGEQRFHPKGPVSLMEDRIHSGREELTALSCCAPDTVSFYLEPQNAAETLWLDRVLQNRSSWERKDRTTRRDETNKMVEYARSLWKLWLWKRKTKLLPKDDALESAVWKLLLRKIRA